jgi:hypothetical protein
MNQRQYRCLKRICWDYDISPEEMFAVIGGEQSHAGHWNRDDLLVRMLERLSWYDLLEFYSPESLAEKLTTEVVQRVYLNEKRAKYERLAKILRGETVPFTKWGSEYREQCKNTLFSNRWYRS